MSSLTTSHTNLLTSKWQKHITACVVSCILSHRKFYDSECFKILPCRIANGHLPILSDKSTNRDVGRVINYLQCLFAHIDNGFAVAFNMKIFDRSQKGKPSNDLVESYRFEYNNANLQIIKGRYIRHFSIAFRHSQELLNKATIHTLINYFPVNLFDTLYSLDPLPKSGDFYFSFDIEHSDHFLSSIRMVNQNKRHHDENKNNLSVANRNNHKRARAT